ncbi:MAG: hypothetical protein ACREHV_12750 [Rhizomicrobium sp.]
MTMPHDEDAISEVSGRTAKVDRGDLCAEIETYIAMKPFRALAIALLVGIMVGKIIL